MTFRAHNAEKSVTATREHISCTVPVELRIGGLKLTAGMHRALIDTVSVVRVMQLLGMLTFPVPSSLAVEVVARAKAEDCWCAQ